MELPLHKIIQISFGIVQIIAWGVGTTSPTSKLDVSGNIQTTSMTSTTDSTVNSLTIGLGGGSVSTNTTVGANALKNNSIGSENSATGFESLKTNDGNRNSAFGFRSLSNTTSGSENSAFGWNAFISNTTGSGNVALGRNAGAAQANGSTSLTNAHESVYIGKDVRGFDNSDNNTIVIGSGAIGAGANKTVIGNSLTTDSYFGSDTANSNLHGLTLYSGSSSTPGCIVMGDTTGGVGYITLNSGVLTVSSTKPSACQ